jgi:hypothetical protein
MPLPVDRHASPVTRISRPPSRVQGERTLSEVNLPGYDSLKKLSARARFKAAANACIVKFRMSHRDTPAVHTGVGCGCGGVLW